MGRDWRSPGEAWVKTESLGWQRMKIIESQLHPSCYQSPTCSWPPRSEFGQHMANHCAGNDSRVLAPRDSSLNRDSFSSASSSGESSRSGSVSPSPTNSPEKTAHQIHPITISSPYGKYSCCSHHFEVGSPVKSSLLGNQTDNEHQNAQLPRSLSREPVLIDSTQTIRDTVLSSSQNPKLSTKPIDQISNNNDRISDSKENNDTGSRRHPIDSGPLSPPILMKNGTKLDNKDLLSCDQVNSYNSNSPQEFHTCCCAHIKNSINLCQQQKKPYVKTAPHCRISVRTREVAMYNTISEAFYRLDFCNAIHDIRRFNYICKLLHLLITQNLTSLSGCATKVLFTMLEQVAWEVSSNKRNIHVLKNLLDELRQMIQKYYCWGRPIGSSSLWRQHFDTIERISQIVDGIELSPPKNDGNQITFTNLPTEMIREILLRLSDHRDLVNSAKASPVMRTMIDNQYIWKQLCRYHFNEQQLKMAVESNSCRFTVGKKDSARGVKYARTTSADGLTSFRNPVNHETNLKSTPSTSSPTHLTTIQQLEQTKGRRGGMARGQAGANEQPGSSYVTRAIKIFDGEGRSTTLGTSRVDRSALPQHELRIIKHAPINRETTTTDKQQLNSTSAMSGSQRNEVDWERVFHHLRKKFDLKEEYADCLLLCRHCRCLFWKSFGHPCISDSSNRSTRRNARNELQQQDHALNVDGESRMSVAALSRNFDNRAQGLAAAGRYDEAENAAPQYEDNFRRSQSMNQRNMNGANGLDARLRGRYIRAVNRQRAEENNDNIGHNNNNNNLQARQTMSRDDLVPKHVAVSPQAFLKFFSL